MRRFFAFIIMVVSIVVAIIFNTQAVMDSRRLSLDYGGGRELVYSLTERENGSQVDAEKIGDNILNRLDKVGIRNAEIELVGNTSLRITLAAQTSLDYSNARQMIEANGSLTVCTADDYCIPGYRFFRDDIATVYYSGLNGYPGLNVRTTEIYNDIVTHAGEVGDESLRNNLYVWENRLESDSYQEAFGSDDPNEDMADKVIATIDYSEMYNENLNALIVSADKDGNGFSTSSARAWVNARNSTDYGVDIKYLYENKVAATLGSSSVNMALIASGVALALIAILLCLYYGFSGLIATVSIAGGLLLDILVFSFLGFEFSPAALVGLIITIALGVFISVNYFERVKDELSKGRNIAKANQEGYRKSFFATLDSCAVFFVISLFGFLLGTGTLKTLGGVCMIGSFAIFLITNYLNKWMMYWLTTSSTFAKNNGGFGLKAKKVVEKKSAEEKEVSPKAKNKKNLLRGAIVAGSIIVVSVASLLGFGLSGNLYSYSDPYVTNGRIDMVTTDETYLDAISFEEGMATYLGGLNLELEYEDITFNRVQMYDEYDEEYYTTYISLKTESEVTDVAIIDALNNMLVDEDDEATVTVSRSRPAGISHNNNSIYLVLGMTILFAVIYLLLRYGWFVSLSMGATYLVSGLFSIAITSLFRLPYNIYTGFAFIGAMFVLSFIGITIFARNKDIIKDSKLKRPTSEQRTEMLSQAMSLSSTSVLSVGIAVTIMSIVGAALTGTEMLSTFLVFILTVALGIFLLYFLSCPLYITIRTHFKLELLPKINAFMSKVGAKIKKALHIKSKKKAVNPNEPKETVVPGINDYR